VFHRDPSHDPGRRERVLAASRRSDELELELLVQIAAAEPTAVASLNLIASRKNRARPTVFEVMRRYHEEHIDRRSAQCGSVTARSWSVIVDGRDCGGTVVQGPTSLSTSTSSTWKERADAARVAA
jgi:hypothetical protein